MATSTKTRLELVNSILLSCGERTISASGGTQGQLVQDCIKESLIDMCTGATWNELRDYILATWSGDRATLDSNVYRIANAWWYSSPDGSPEATYDYPRQPLKFITMQEYLRFPLTPYTNAAQNMPRYWTLEDNYTARVNPYPNDSTERNKITFEVYKLVPFPSTDSNNFNCSDQFLNAVQYKAAALFAMKFLSDSNLAQTYSMQYETLRRKLLVGDSALPTGGYTLYRGNRV